MNGDDRIVERALIAQMRMNRYLWIRLVFLAHVITSSECVN